jgi:hypothetical protein
MSTTLSQRIYNVGGIEAVVHGLDEIPPSTKAVSCIWLLHPRLATRDWMTALATRIIGDWNQKIKEKKAGPNPDGLIAIGFDQRNHGGRLLQDISNQSWKDGNNLHAQDMFASYRK